jgi:uncharacterized protein (TIGR03067 family)
MRKWQITVWVALFAMSLTAVHAEEKKFDREKILGKWTYQAGQKSGIASEIEALQKSRVTITKETITLEDDNNKFVIKYTIDTSKTPAVIDMEITESPFGAGAKAIGIIALDGETLKICYAPMGEKAPEKFETKEGSSTHMFMLKRAK